MGQAGFDEALWAFGRGCGVMALVLLTVAVVAGIVARSGRAVVLPRTGMAVFHRGAALTATGLVTVHVVSLLLDPWAQLRLLDVVVPFTGEYRPLWVGFGAVAVDVLAAVTVSGLLRRHIGPHLFRAVHWATYVLWPVAVVHALGAGTDAFRPWLLGVLVACTAAVVAAVGWRMSQGFSEIRTPLVGVPR
ncbi:ferric reductase-like transmembrane domain-containing protein [Nocardia sp. NPDC059240]|uniref:ferric reductase-like transmembrane domain-containing protein n=1 Tax=Nocardia sp. NPDC059240 TaxID=3346786 RepID=UPI0036C25172